MFRIINFQFALITFKHIYIFKSPDSTLCSRESWGRGGGGGDVVTEMSCSVSSNSLVHVFTNEPLNKNSTHLFSVTPSLSLAPKHVRS